MEFFHQGIKSAQVPIVYYEGTENWTADRHLRDQIGQPMDCSGWIPDFAYELVRIHDYSNEELLNRGDEMSLVMLFNKVQDAAGLKEFQKIPPEKMDQIVRESPGHVLEVIVSVMESLCFKIGASENERRECVRKGSFPSQAHSSCLGVVRFASCSTSSSVM